VTTSTLASAPSAQDVATQRNQHREGKRNTHQQRPLRQQLRGDDVDPEDVLARHVGILARRQGEQLQRSLQAGAVWTERADHLADEGHEAHTAVREEERARDERELRRTQQAFVEDEEESDEHQRGDDRRDDEGAGAAHAGPHQQAGESIGYEGIVEALLGEDRILGEPLADLPVREDVGVREVNDPVGPQRPPARIEAVASLEEHPGPEQAEVAAPAHQGDDEHRNEAGPLRRAIGYHRGRRREARADPERRPDERGVEPREHGRTGPEGRASRESRGNRGNQESRARREKQRESREGGAQGRAEEMADGSERR
jgi:hypothetical protein